VYGYADANNGGKEMLLELNRIKKSVCVEKLFRKLLNCQSSTAINTF